MHDNERYKLGRERAQITSPSTSFSWSYLSQSLFSSPSFTNKADFFITQSLLFPHLAECIRFPSVLTPLPSRIALCIYSSCFCLQRTIPIIWIQFQVNHCLGGGSFFWGGGNGFVWGYLASIWLIGVVSKVCKTRNIWYDLDLGRFGPNRFGIP